MKTIASNYLSLIAFSHTVFALPFAVIGFFLALHKTGETFSLKKFILVIMCMVFARSAAMAFNRYTDRSIDKLNARTSEREIPAGVIKPTSALLFVIINSLLFSASAYLINPLCFLLSPVALAIILGYSYTKRFTFLSHFVLGLGLSLAPVGAFIAVTGKFEFVPVLFSLVVLCWVSGFDIIYSLQDEEFDKQNKLYSIPAFFGKKKALILSSATHFIAAVFILSAGILGNFGTWYWLGAMFFIGILIYQHRLVKPDDLSKVNLAFFTLNGIASVLFACFVLADFFL